MTSQRLLGSSKDPQVCPPRWPARHPSHLTILQNSQPLHPQTAMTFCNPHFSVTYLPLYPPLPRGCVCRLTCYVCRVLIPFSADRRSAHSPSYSSPVAAGAITTVIEKPRRRFNRPQSLIKLEKALERLNAPLPERPNTVTIGPPHDNNLPELDSGSNTDQISLGRPRWPSLPGPMEGLGKSQLYILPLRPLVVFVDVRSHEGDNMSQPFALILRDMGAKVCDLWDLVARGEGSRTLGLANLWFIMHPFSIQGWTRVDP